MSKRNVLEFLEVNDSGGVSIPGGVGNLGASGYINFTSASSFIGAGNNAIQRDANSGLVFTGQGATSDFTFINDLGTTWLNVPSGTTNAVFAGDALFNGSTGSIYNSIASGSLSIAGGNANNAGGNIILRGQSHSTEANYLKFRNGTTNALVIDGNQNATIGGNVAIDGASLPAWGVTTYSHIVLGSGYQVFGRTNEEEQGGFLANAYYDGTNWVRIGDGYAYRMYSDGGTGGGPLIVQNGGTSTAGSAITWTDALRIDRATNNVAIGTTAPDVPLHVKGGSSTESAIIVDSTGVGGGHKYGIRPGSPGVSNAHFTIHDETNDATRFVITDGGLVLINTTAAVAGQQLRVHGNAGSGTIAIAAATNFNSQLQFGDPANSAIGQIIYAHNGDSMRFHTNGSERLRILSGGGLTFNGDTASANALDDYEQGTWTANLEGVTNNPTTAVTATGTYTKIGRLVYAAVGFTNKNTGGASGDVQVTGMPFSSVTTMPSGNVMSYLTIQVNNATGNISPYFANSTQLRFYETLQGANAWQASVHSAGNARYLYLSVMYETS